MNHVKLVFGMLASVMLIACQPADEMAEEPAAAPAAPAAETAMPAAAPAAAPPEQSSTVTYSLINEATWVNLFAGHDLSQFIEVGGADWNIVDDYVEATSGTGTGFLVTRGAYGDVQLQAEFWTSPDANSGIFMRCPSADGVSDTACYEVNIFDQRPDQTYRTGGIVHLAAPMAQMDAADRWNTFDIIMDGDHLVVRMNDTLMVDMNDSMIERGVIAFQWGSGTVRFRNIRLRPL